VDNYTEELIAVGAAVCTNCQPCLKYLVEKARKKGAAADEIAEAVRVGVRIRDVAARKMDGFAGALLSDRAAVRKEAATDCGCG